MSYRVTIEPSGRCFTCSGTEAVLDAALRHGIMLPYGCRDGRCGLCTGKVVEGSVTYPGGEPPEPLDEKAFAVGQALFCRARPTTDLTIELREADSFEAIPAHRTRCRVERMERLAPDVMGLHLQPPEHERIAFLPGQYVDVLLRDGRRRSFCLANAPHDDATLEIHVRRVEAGEFSGHVFHAMQPQAVLHLEGPYGDFHLRAGDTRPLLAMAGSTGIAPIKSMLEHLVHIGDERPVHVFWGVRTREDLYLDTRLRQLARAHGRLQYTPCLSDPAANDAWEGRIGLVHNMLLQDYPDLAGYTLYMSGPPSMIAAAERDLSRHGADPEHMLANPFHAAADAKPDLTDAEHRDQHQGSR